jgi:hypothetical protein
MIKNKGKEIIGWVYPDPVCVKFANISRRKFPNSTEKISKFSITIFKILLEKLIGTKKDLILNAKIRKTAYLRTNF